MAQLAIKGHETRGKEVIEILEMLGGQNYSHYFLGKTKYNYYYIGNYSTINCIPKEKLNDLFITFTLEEFLEKFPYKIGDRVRIPEYESEVCISKMYWNGNEVQYEVVTYEVEWYSAKELNEFNEPNKKETMEDIIKIDIPKGYEFAGVDNQQVVFEKIEYQYPKIYDECCEVLFPTTIELGKVSAHGYNGKLLEKFGELIICRDTYWKIAGEQMRLDKPWSPSKSDSVYCIFRFKGDIVKDNFVFGDSLLLEFPTEEMRDAFFKNFKDLIEQCKELL